MGLQKKNLTGEAEPAPDTSADVAIGTAIAGGDVIVQVGHQEKPAPKPIQRFEPEMVSVPAGPFLMGREPGQECSAMLCLERPWPART